MAPTADELEALIRESQTALSEMEQQLRKTQAAVSGLGFFARGFVEKDISSATGRGFDNWIDAIVRLRDALLDAPAFSPQHLKVLTDELPQVGVLRNYVQSAPQKMGKVPAAVLKPQQRAEFVQRVADQEAELRVLEAKLRSIASAVSQPG